MLEVRRIETAKTIYRWYVEYKEGRLDLAPSYGRNSEPWSEKEKALLIDSVLNGWDIRSSIWRTLPTALWISWSKGSPTRSSTAAKGSRLSSVSWTRRCPWTPRRYSLADSAPQPRRSSSWKAPQCGTSMRHPGLVGWFENFKLRACFVESRVEIGLVRFLE